MYKGMIPFNTEHSKYDLKSKNYIRKRGKFLIAYDSGDSECHKEPNAEFEATLVYTGMGRGRSSAVFYYENKEGTFSAQMFMREMGRMIELGITPLEVSAVWCFQKKGANFGLEFVKEVI